VKPHSVPHLADVGASDKKVARYAEAEMPSLHGPVRVRVYREVGAGSGQSMEEALHPLSKATEHVALIYGSPLAYPSDVLVRIHSECVTSEVFGSTKCDCREQLIAAMERAQASEHGGVILYLRQEGRGIGLGNKIRAYELQQQGYDTVQANHQLGFDTDLRRYDVAACMLKDLGAKGVTLLTNNPRKVDGLKEAGIDVLRRAAHEIPPHIHNAKYLATKRARLGHMLELSFLPTGD